MMQRPVLSVVLTLTCCLGQQVIEGQVSAQQPAIASRPEVTREKSSGAAGGVWSPALTGERRPLYRLCKSDVLEIDFTFSPELDQTVIVQPDGFIALRGKQQLYAQGVTVPELEEAVKDAYGQTLNDPEITIVLKDFDRPSFIAGGEVGHPGKYELRADTTLTAALAIAGGFTAQARHSEVILFRRVSETMVESRVLNVKSLLHSRNLNEDIYLRPGDMIYVPKNTVSKIKQYLPVSNLSTYFTPTQ